MTYRMRFSFLGCDFIKITVLPKFLSLPKEFLKAEFIKINYYKLILHILRAF